MNSEINYHSTKNSNYLISNNNYYYSNSQQNKLKFMERKRNIIYLIINYLKFQGYKETLNIFESESNINNNSNYNGYILCDNIDLETIIQEYETYYYFKFNKNPKITKKIENNINISINSNGDIHNVINNNKNNKLRIKSASNLIINKRNIKHNNNEDDVCKNEKNKNEIIQNNNERKINNQDGSLKNNNIEFNNIVVTPFQLSTQQQQQNQQQQQHQTLQHLQKNQQPFINYENIELNLNNIKSDYPDDWKPFVDIIKNEIYINNLNITWNDIIGLETTKNLLKETIIYPIKYPEYFQGLLSPWKSILLHGPPGTGKTLLAKAIASEYKSLFFNISPSSLISKWRGESEKLVRILFDLAYQNAPSTIFIDEIDAIICKRDNDYYEPSRRFKSELLIQLDGINQNQNNQNVLILATSNSPWDLDTALLRRFEKRIHIDIPDLNARKNMIEYFLPPIINDNPRLCSELDYNLLATNMEGYSGSDIKLVCKEAAMKSLREIFDVLDKKLNKTQIKNGIKLKPITTQQVLQTLQKIKPVADYKLYYKKWQNDFGSC